MFSACGNPKEIPSYIRLRRYSVSASSRLVFYLDVDHCSFALVIFFRQFLNLKPNFYYHGPLLFYFGSKILFIRPPIFNRTISPSKSLVFSFFFVHNEMPYSLSPFYEALTKHTFRQNTGTYAMCFKALSTMRILSFAGEAWFLSL